MQNAFCAIVGAHMPDATSKAVADVDNMSAPPAAERRCGLSGYARLALHCGRWLDICHRHLRFRTATLLLVLQRETVAMAVAEPEAEPEDSGDNPDQYQQVEAVVRRF
ncbi:MAG: hypothetical protein ACRELF_12590 [Gemmataceae bacterium]